MVMQMESGRLGLGLWPGKEAIVNLYILARRPSGSYAERLLKITAAWLIL
jgi:hypothetical protein